MLNCWCLFSLSLKDRFLYMDSCDFKLRMRSVQDCFEVVEVSHRFSREIKLMLLFDLLSFVVKLSFLVKLVATFIWCHFLLLFCFCMLMRFIFVLHALHIQPVHFNWQKMLAKWCFQLSCCSPLICCCVFFLIFVFSVINISLVGNPEVTALCQLLLKTLKLMYDVRFWECFM